MRALACCIYDAGGKVDPTGTGNIRTRFEREMKRRFNTLRMLIRKALIELDVLGLGKGATIEQRLAAAMFGSRASQPGLVGDAAPSQGAFAFARRSDKVAAFMEWLREEQARGILGIVPGQAIRQSADSSWMNVYIETAYQKGIRDAGKKMRGAGANVKESWINGAFNRPIHADRVGLIFTRAFQDLEGINAAMAQKISRALALGVAEGRNPIQIAKAISEEIESITNARAIVLARTEVISAHAEATLNAYQEAGIEGVEVEAEISTAGDDRVCPECEDLEGDVMTLEEARNVIPVHPQCRCAWLPVIVGGSGITLQ